MLTLDLFPYQIPGQEMFLERGNLLLSMYMGLGKTTVSIACIEHLLGEGEISTALIVSPAALLWQWAEEIASCADVETRTIKVDGEEMTVPTEGWCVIVAGTPRQKQAALERLKSNPPQYIITSYDTAASNSRLFKKLAGLVVIDEASALKGFKSARAKAMRRLTVPYRLALTGAPVENHRPEEAYGIMAWVAPEIFGAYYDFERAYIRRDKWGRPTRYVNLDVMHRLLSKAMYRKLPTDPDVAPYLPTVRRERWTATLDTDTRVVYLRILRDLRDELAKSGPNAKFDMDAYYAGGDDGSGAGKAAVIHQAALMLLDHPKLLLESAQKYVTSATKGTKSGGSEYVFNLVTSPDNDIPGLGSPKLALLRDRLLELLVNPDHKFVVVSRYVGMLPIIAEALGEVGTVQYHGEMTARARAGVIAQFEQDPSTRVLIMSNAGAYGLNLPWVKLLVNYDPPRSAGQGWQIDARHVRASTEYDEVGVADVVVEDTLEERLREQLDLKGRVASAVTDGVGTDTFGVIRNDVMSLTKYVQDALLAA